MTEPQQNPDNAPETPAEAANANNDGTAAEIAGLKDQLLRALAEAENTRRRAAKEREDTAKYAVGNFAKEMLNVADNFARALESAPKDTADATIKNLITGLEATDRQLQAALERFGIKKIEPVGQIFDPNFHRPMVEVEDTTVPAGTVIQVLQAGYLIHDRLLREALVSVAKGGAQPGPKVDTSA